MIAPEAGGLGPVRRNGASALSVPLVPDSSPTLHDPAIEDQVRAGLLEAEPHLRAAGVGLPPLEGRLLRPTVALRFIRPENRDDLPLAFWFGCWAIQMVHEASLLHDDVLDGGSVRRGRPTLLAEKGRAASLIQGDAYLTDAYVVADRVGKPRFMSRFVHAVRDTVRGEMLQAAPGRETEWRDILALKTGALFGLCASLASEWDCPLDGGEAYALGVELGVLYQRVDDFLDYCPAADTGKPPLQDFRKGIRTWMVPNPDLDWFRQSDRQLCSALFGGGGDSWARLQLDRLERDVERWSISVRSHGLEVGLARLPQRWANRCRRALESEEEQRWRAALDSGRRTASPSTIRSRVETLGRGMGGPESWDGVFARGSRSFSFAARLFPAEARARIAGIYTFCRFTDDLVDEAENTAPADLDLTLDHWAYLCRSAHGGEETGIPVLDVVIGGMGREGLPLEYPLELIEGVRMDIRPPVYRTMDHLRLYTYRVASVVGGWMVQSFGISDPWVVDRAFGLGHAMQLTNILRDVGEDLDAGRVYLPADLLLRHGLCVEDLMAMRHGGWIDPAYPGLVEEVMAAADESYAAAFEGLASVPGFFARPVAAAARIYQGIHDRIRANGYDNLTSRARTGLAGKIRLAGRGLADLRKHRADRASLGLWIPGGATRAP